MGSPAWSADGRQIAIEYPVTGRPAVFVLPSGGGQPRPLVSDKWSNSQPGWSHDGRWLYFYSDRDATSDLWRIPLAGGSPSRVTRHTGTAPQESPDGRFLYYFNTGGIWRMPIVDGNPSGEETRIVPPLPPGDRGNWAPANDGVYYIQRDQNGYGTILFQPATEDAPRTIYRMSKRPVNGAGGLALSPDGKTLLFAQVDTDGASIFAQ
jgi:Tol biopolymer transport system component